MPQEEYRMVYELKRGERTVHCESFAQVSVLLAAGWTLKGSVHLTRLGHELANGTSPATPDPAPRSQ